MSKSILSLVVLAALSPIRLDNEDIAVGQVFGARPKDAQPLIDCGAAREATEEEDATFKGLASPSASTSIPHAPSPFANVAAGGSGTSASTAGSDAPAPGTETGTGSADASSSAAPAPAADASKTAAAKTTAKPAAKTAGTKRK
jgi:hypothetical protein